MKLPITASSGSGSAGGASGVTIGTTVITSGTNTRVLFDDSAVVGESAGLTYVKATGTLTATALVAPTLISSTSVSTPIVFSPIATGTLALNATAPAATIGASQVGKTVSVTASAAVASTDTNGAAAGGSVTITAGAAARLVSGNGDGGMISLVPGAAIGTGRAGKVLVPIGTAADPGIAGSAGSQNTGFLLDSAGQIDASLGGTATVRLATGRVQVHGAPATGFYVHNEVINNASDYAQYKYIANGVAGIAGASITNGWLQNSGGEASLAADFTRSDTTLTATNLSRTVISGRTYNFEANLYITQGTAASGWKLDFNGGSAAMTYFVARAYSTALTGIIVVLTNGVSAALATVINAGSTITTTGQLIRIVGSFVPSGNGTFILRAAADSGVGTLTILRGSSLIIRDTPAL